MPLLESVAPYIMGVWNMTGSYIVSYGLFEYGIPWVLKLIGFGLEGIVIGSIAAWLQRSFGTPYLFKLLQSIGARGGIAYAKVWSFIFGSMFGFDKSVITLGTASSLKSTPKVKQTEKNYFSWMVGLLICVCALIIHVISRSALVQEDQRPAGRVTQQLEGNSNETVPETVISNSRSKPKVTEILGRNVNGKYTCPGCEREFAPQGITRHLRACDPEWFSANGIDE